ANPARFPPLVPAPLLSPRVFPPASSTSQWDLGGWLTLLPKRSELNGNDRLIGTETGRSVRGLCKTACSRNEYCTSSSGAAGFARVFLSTLSVARMCQHDDSRTSVSSLNSRHA